MQREGLGKSRAEHAGTLAVIELKGRRMSWYHPGCTKDEGR